MSKKYLLYSIFLWWIVFWDFVRDDIAEEKKLWDIWRKNFFMILLKNIKPYGLGKNNFLGLIFDILNRDKVTEELTWENGWK